MTSNNTGNNRFDKDRGDRGEYPPLRLVPPIEQQVEQVFAGLDLTGVQPPKPGPRLSRLAAIARGVRAWSAPILATLATAVLLAVLVPRSPGDVAAAWTVYGLGWIGYAAWHAVGRPAGWEIAERLADCRYRKTLTDTDNQHDTIEGVN